MDLFELATVEELIAHGLRALASSSNDTTLSVENASVAIVGKDTPFEILNDAKLEPYIDALKAERAAMPQAPMEEEPAPPPAGEDDDLVEAMEMD